MDWTSSLGEESILIKGKVETHDTSSVPIKRYIETHQTPSVPITTEVETHQTGETVPIKAEDERGQRRKSVTVKLETERDQLADMAQHHNMYGRDCHFKTTASTTGEINLSGTAHPADLETAPIKFEADFYQSGCVARGSVRYETDLNQTSPMHSDDRETGDVHVKIESHDISTNTPLSIKQEVKCAGANDFEDKPEHAVYPVGLYQNIHVTAHLAENVHGHVTSEKCDASDSDTCPDTCVMGLQNISDRLPSERFVGHSSQQQTSTDRDVSKATLDTYRMEQSGEKSSVCKQYDTVVARHMRTHTGHRPYQCTKCDASFEQSRDLKGHIQTHTGGKPFICNQCGIAFTWSCHLKRHMQSHTGDKPYVCEHCDAAFTHSGNLNTHMSIHTGEKPYVCKQCNAAFRRSGDLKSHMRTHTGDRPYVCEMCDSAFARSSDLKRHEQVHTGDKPYVCEVCNAAFPQSTKLKYHMRTHTGEKPYVCQLCGAAFALSCTLKNHMRTHTGDKPFVCTMCDASFTQSGPLKKHMHKKHTDKQLSF